jgi:flagellar hook-associated protein 2
MASVYNNVSNNSLSSSVRGYGGLASGLDRDSLIQGMTAGTRAKIAKQQKRQTDSALETGGLPLHQYQAN